MNVLIYVDPYEPVTQLLLNKHRELKLKPYNLDNFLDHTEVFDEFNKKRTKISWKDPAVGKITNSRNTRVINRVYYLPDQWFKKFHVKDREYAKQELYAYFTFAFNSFQKISEKPNLGSLSGGCYPLPHQWNMMHQCSKEIKVPEFYFGPLLLLPKTMEKKAIFSSLYNFYSWKINEAPQKNDSVFAIKKPAGEPVLACVCGNQWFLRPIENQAFVIKKDDEKKIKSAAKKLHSKLGFFVSESLFFINGNEITFGMMHNIPSAASKYHDFESMLLEETEKWMQ